MKIKVDTITQSDGSKNYDVVLTQGRNVIRLATNAKNEDDAIRDAREISLAIMGTLEDVDDSLIK